MLLKGWDSLVLLQVLLAVRIQTAEARLLGLERCPNTDVTGNLPIFGSDVALALRHHVAEMLHHVSEFCVDLEPWLLLKALKAEWTTRLVSAGPKARDTGLTIVVSAGSGDGLGERIPTGWTAGAEAMSR